MKILFLLEGENTPSSRLRVLPYINHVHNAGFDIKLIYIPNNFLYRWKIFIEAYLSDIVFIQKKLFHYWEIYFLSKLNKNIIYDFDDAVMYSSNNGLSSDFDINRNKYKRFLKTVQASKWVIAGSKDLKNSIKFYAEKIAVIPTPIDTDRYIPKLYKQKGEDITIGWIGTKGNLIYLNLIKNVLSSLAKKYSIFLKIVCDDFIDIEGVPIIKKKWSLEDEIVDLQSFDIGIMPLIDNPWTRGKCGFKILQYMGVAVPVVCSNVGINKSIIKDGINGYLASNENEWYNKLSILIKDSDHRKDIGIKGIETIQKEYSLKLNLQRFLEVLYKTYDN